MGTRVHGTTVYFLRDCGSVGAPASGNDSSNTSLSALGPGVAGWPPSCDPASLTTSFGTCGQQQQRNLDQSTIERALQPRTHEVTEVMDAGLCTRPWFHGGSMATNEIHEKSLAVMSGRELLRTKFTPVGRDDSNWDIVTPLTECIHCSSVMSHLPDCRHDSNSNRDAALDSVFTTSLVHGKC